MGDVGGLLMSSGSWTLLSPRSLLCWMLTSRAHWLATREDWKNFWSGWWDRHDPWWSLKLSSDQNHFPRAMWLRWGRVVMSRNQDEIRDTREEIQWLIFTRATLHPSFWLSESMRHPLEWWWCEDHMYLTPEQFGELLSRKNFRKRLGRAITPGSLTRWPWQREHWVKLFQSTSGACHFDRRDLLTVAPNLDPTDFVKNHHTHFPEVCRILWRGQGELITWCLEQLGHPSWLTHLVDPKYLKWRPTSFTLDERFSWKFVSRVLDQRSQRSDSSALQVFRPFLNSLVCHQTFLEGLLAKWFSPVSRLELFPLKNGDALRQRWESRDRRLVHFWTQHFLPVLLATPFLPKQHTDQFSDALSRFLRIELRQILRRISGSSTCFLFEIYCPRFVSTLREGPEGNNMTWMDFRPGYEFHLSSSHLHELQISTPPRRHILHFCLWYLDSEVSLGSWDPAFVDLIDQFFTICLLDRPLTNYELRKISSDVRDLLFSLAAHPHPWVVSFFASSLSPQFAEWDLPSFHSFFWRPDLDPEQTLFQSTVKWIVEMESWIGVRGDCSICRWFNRQIHPEQVVRGLRSLAERGLLASCDCCLIFFCLFPDRHCYLCDWAASQELVEMVRRSLIWCPVTSLSPECWVILMKLLIRDPEEIKLLNELYEEDEEEKEEEKDPKGKKKILRFQPLLGVFPLLWELPTIPPREPHHNEMVIQAIQHSPHLEVRSLLHWSRHWHMITFTET